MAASADKDLAEQIDTIRADIASLTKIVSQLVSDTAGIHASLKQRISNAARSAVNEAEKLGGEAMHAAVTGVEAKIERNPLTAAHRSRVWGRDRDLHPQIVRRRMSHSRNSSPQSKKRTQTEDYSGEGPPIRRRHVPWFRRSRKSLPVLKNGTYFPVTETVVPVRGLRPTRAGRFLTETAPKPRSSTRSPRDSASVIWRRMTLTICSTCAGRGAGWLR
jgi:hypothetical protein